MLNQLLLKKNVPYLLLLICCVPLFFLHIHTGHSSGGDDYAQYIKEAKNLSEGRPYYLSHYVFNSHNNIYSPPQYPPGFPLLLAPVVRYFGIAIRPMCYFNSCVAVLLLFCFFAFFRKYMQALPAIIVALMVTYSGIMTDLKQFILSDYTNLLFVMLYLVARKAPRFTWQRIALLSVFAAMAVLIRTQSILLIMAELAFLFFACIRQWRVSGVFPGRYMLSLPSLYIAVGFAVLTLLLNKVVFYCPVSTSGFYTQFLQSTLEKGIPAIIRDNVNFFLQSIQALFHFETYMTLRTALVTVIECAGLVLCITGFAISVSRRLAFDDLFFIFSCVLMLYYTVHDARYFLPAIAIVYYYCYISLERIIPALTTVRLRTVGLVLALLYFTAGYSTYKNATGEPYQYIPAQNDNQAFEYIKSHVNDTDVILCARPRMLTLYTDKRSMIFAWQHTPAENKAVFDSLGVKYVLVIEGVSGGEFLHNYLNQYGHPKDSLYIADRYLWYTLK